MKTYDDGSGTHGKMFRWTDFRARIRRWFDREREIVTLRNAVGMMSEARRSDAAEYHEMREGISRLRDELEITKAHLAHARAALHAGTSQGGEG